MNYHKYNLEYACKACVSSCLGVKEFLLQHYKPMRLMSFTIKQLFLLLILIVWFNPCVFANDLASYKSVKVGVYNNPPLSYIDENNNAQGVFIDIINFIAKKENLQIEYIRGTWSRLLGDLHVGKIDVLPGVIFDGDSDSVFMFNELPLLTSWLELYSILPSEFSSFKDVNGKRVGVLRHTMDEKYLNDYLQENSLAHFDLISFESTRDMHDALKSKSIDAFVSDRFFKYSELCEKNELYSGLSFRPYGLHFAFTQKAENKYLVDLFNKEVLDLINVSGSVYYESLRTHLDSYYQNYIPKYVLWIIITLACILMLALAYSIVISYNIRVKNKSLKLSNQSLIIAVKKAEESDRLKSAFLQNISHEIRTPLNGILGFVELLKTRDLSIGMSDKFIDIINENGKRLINTVTDIVEISKIETDSIEVKKSAINVNELLTSLKESFESVANKKNLQLLLDETLFLGSEIIIESDISKLEVILTNLLNNAIKFTTNGMIEMGCYLKNSNMVFSVKDTGIGIAEEKQRIVFDRFRQSNELLNRNYEGSGLGLAIASSHVKALEGEIWLKSKLGEGSTFFFAIPYVPLKVCKGKKEKLIA